MCVRSFSFRFLHNSLGMHPHAVISLSTKRQDGRRHTFSETHASMAMRASAHKLG
jgi:hypothetical protein